MSSPCFLLLHGAVEDLMEDDTTYVVSLVECMLRYWLSARLVPSM
jgi:hypothetical protein